MNMRRLFMTLVYELDMDMSVETDQEAERKKVQTLMPKFYKKVYKSVLSEAEIDVAIAWALSPFVSHVPSPSGIESMMVSAWPPPTISHTEKELCKLAKQLNDHEYGGWLRERASLLFRGGKSFEYGLYRAGKGIVWLTFPEFDEETLHYICCGNPFSGQLALAIRP